MIRVPWVVLLVACAEGDPSQGTAVGNPGNLDVSVADVPDEVDLDVATVYAADLLLFDCDVGVALVPVQAPLDGLAASTVEVPLPRGRWCSGLLTLDPRTSGQVVIGGTTDGGTRFSVALNPGALRLPDDVVVDGTEWLLVMSLADSLDVLALEARGSNVEVTADDPDAIAWALALDGAATLFEDGDRDGVLSDADSIVGGPSDTGFMSLDRMDTGLSEADAGCGCQMARGIATWWVFLLPWWVRRRCGDTHPSSS